jgi:hypothetical protein
MRVTMTFQTLAVKRFQYRTVVWAAVAITTIRYRGMLGLVTKCTFEGAMFGLTFREHLENIRVACPAIFIWYIVSIFNI